MIRWLLGLSVLPDRGVSISRLSRCCIDPRVLWSYLRRPPMRTSAMTGPRVPVSALLNNSVSINGIELARRSFAGKGRVSCPWTICNPNSPSRLSHRAFIASAQCGTVACERACDGIGRVCAEARPSPWQSPALTLSCISTSEERTPEPTTALRAATSYASNAEQRDVAGLVAQVCTAAVSGAVLHRRRAARDFCGCHSIRARCKA